MVDLQTVVERLEALNAYIAELDHYAHYSFGELTSEFAEHLAPLAGFRNILIHDYLVVDAEKVYGILIQGRADLREFGRHITEYLQRSE